VQIEKREQLKGPHCWESNITVYVSGLFRDIADYISHRSKMLVRLAHASIGFSLIVFGIGLTGISQIFVIVLGFVVAIPFVENLALHIIGAFFRKS